MAEQYEWGHDYNRKVVALAVRGDLLKQAPGAFQARFFALPTAVKPPIMRIAEIVERQHKLYPGEVPGVVSMDILVEAHAQQLKQEERQALQVEWQAIRSLPVPDPTYVIDRVRQWAQRAALSAAVYQLAQHLDKTGNGAIDGQWMLRTMTDAVALGQPESQGAYLLGDMPTWIARWGEDQGEKAIPTGFTGLDLVLGGGPRKGDSIYFLAPPKGAKTASQLSALMHAARNQFGGCLFSYEMTLWKMINRLTRNMSKKTKTELHQYPGYLSQIAMGWKAAGAGEVFIQQFEARKHGCAEAARIVERQRAAGMQVDLVVLDYLNIMSSQKGEKEKRHELAQISRDISALAKEADVVVLSAALVRREAVNKIPVTKTDIAEAFEVIAVCDGAVALCSNKELRLNKRRRMYAAALRDEEDERFAGEYLVDLDRMTFKEVPPMFDDSKQEGSE